MCSIETVEISLIMSWGEKRYKNIKFFIKLPEETNKTDYVKYVETLKHLVKD